MHVLVALLQLISTIPATTEALVARFLQRADPPPSQSVALRHLEASNRRFGVSGWLDACVTVSGPTFTFTVIREGGSGYIRSKVLRKALESERDLVLRGDPAKAQLSADNYDVRFEGTAPAGQAFLHLRPKRRDILLLEGRALVTDPDADLISVEGRLSQTPSFWTRSVDVTRRYARLGGIRVPVETSSVADVRIAGQSEFHMQVDYASINGATVATNTAAAACLPAAK